MTIMPCSNRRAFLRSSAFALVGAPSILAAPPSTSVRVVEIRPSYEDFRYRAPLKFGGSIVDRVTLLNVHCRIESADGRSADGFGSMPLGNVWSFPSKTMPYEKTLGAMKSLAERIGQITRDYREAGHPIDINMALEPAYLQAARDISQQLRLDALIPKLCTLVTASPFDAAIHDAYGKLHGVNCFRTLGKGFLRNDLGHYLGNEFRGESLDSYVLSEPKGRMPLYHLVGAVDPLTDADIKTRIGDGLPETLPEWIRYNGLTNIKIKLNGDDNDWDVNRVVSIDRVTTQTQEQRGVSRWVYSLDFNEKCPNVQYLITFIEKLKSQAPAAFGRIQYIEQPTARDLKANRQNVMQQASKLLPVVIDESLTGQEELMLAREMGYTGAALKACKGQSQAVLMAAVAQKYKMFLCVQDLTCPGASLIHSASLAAHIPGVAAIEANARQYVPAANAGWEKKFPQIFVIKNGYMQTGVLNRPGIGAV